jgi:hypothetical protein
MLDDLRDQASFQPGEKEPLPVGAPGQSKGRKRRRSSNQKAGITAQQRFVLSLILLVMVCLLGVVLLVVTGKIVLPFGF